MEAETEETEKQKTVHQTQTQVTMKISFFNITSVLSVLTSGWYAVKDKELVVAVMTKFLVAHAISKDSGTTIAVCYLSLN